MADSLAEIISRSLFCEPSQLETSGRILITDCYWTKNFNDCAQFFQAGERYVFAISFRWAPLFQPILEKIRIGSGLNPDSILNLLKDRKTFHGLRIEQLQDVFVNSNWRISMLENPLEWWQAYPIDYSKWLTWAEFRQEIKALKNVNQLGVDARELQSISDLSDTLEHIDSNDTFHLVINQNLKIDADLLKLPKTTVIKRQRIIWDS